MENSCRRILDIVCGTTMKESRFTAFGYFLYVYIYMMDLPEGEFAVYWIMFAS